MQEQLRTDNENDEQALDDRSVGEDCADDLMGNDEQRKLMHERLDAGESPLGCTSEAPVVPSVVDSLMHRPTANARLTGQWHRVPLQAHSPHRTQAWLYNRLLSKEGAKNAGEHRPSMYKSLYWRRCTGSGVRLVVKMCVPGGPGVPAGANLAPAKYQCVGVLLARDETLDLAFEIEQTTAGGVPQAGVFLDCSKCYERVPLHKLETFALKSGYPFYVLYAEHDMYSGRCRVLIQGAVSQPVTATHGMPPGCGHAVDLLHAFLLKTLQSAGRHISVHKCVDDMVLVAKVYNFAGNLCYGYRQVHRNLTAANIQVDLKKRVVICNGAKAKRLLMKVWRQLGAVLCRANVWLPSRNIHEMSSLTKITSAQ
eukprot:1402722-Amphidinium_carterae.2